MMRREPDRYVPSLAWRLVFAGCILGILGTVALVLAWT
jgi:hypothetical protein